MKVKIDYGALPALGSTWVCRNGRHGPCLVVVKAIEITERGVAINFSGDQLSTYAMLDEWPDIAVREVDVSWCEAEAEAAADLQTFGLPVAALDKTHLLAVIARLARILRDGNVDDIPFFR